MKGLGVFWDTYGLEKGFLVHRNDLVTDEFSFNDIVLDLDSLKSFVNNAKRKFKAWNFSERNRDGVMGDEFNHQLNGFVIIHVA